MIWKKRCFWAMICPMMYILVLLAVVPFVYGIVDDRTMMEVISGQYLGTPDAHGFFTGYWYPLLVAGFYRAVRNVDWYALGYIFLQVCCMGLMAWRLTEMQERREDRDRLAGRPGRKIHIWPLALIVLWMILDIKPMTQLSFTTTAAVVAVTVIFWYMTAEEIQIIDLVLLTVLCFLSIELRFSVFCMILPVCGLLWLLRVWENKGADKKNLWIPIAPVLAALLYVAGLFIGYGSEDWQFYNAFNNTRSLIYDYEEYMFPRYEDEHALYHSVGVDSKARAKNLYYYNYTADDRVDQFFFLDYFEKRSEEISGQTHVVQKLRQTVKTYIKGTLAGKYEYLHLAAMSGYAILLLGWILRKDWKRVLETICIPGMQIVLWLYLIYRGRMPERVLISMNLMLMVPLLLLAREYVMDDAGSVSRSAVREACRKTSLALLLAAMVVGAVWKVAAVRTQNLETAKWNENVEKLKAYCMDHPDNFYFNDVTSMAMTTYNVHLWQNDPYVMNYMSLGDWIAYSPVWERKLKQNGISSVKEALYGADNVYLISSFDRGTEYLTELYENISCDEVDKIAGFTVYKLQML